MSISRYLHRIVAMVIAISTILLGVGIGYSQIESRIDLVSQSPFDKTVSKLETSLKEEGMMVVGIIDHQNMMKMVGVSMGGSKTIEFGKPDMAKMIFPDKAEAGLEMPGKIYIWERKDGKTVVSYMNPAPSYAKYNDENLKKVGEMMAKMMEKIVSKAAK